MEEHAMSSVLDIQHLNVAYNRKGLALTDVSLQVPPGGIVALLGANGAGKSTLIRAVTGLLDLHHGQITGGQVHMLGQRVSGFPAHRLVRMGMGQVPEGRLVFKHLSVEDNLLVGAAVLPRTQVKDGLDAVYHLFPRLLERRRQAAGWMSGGEQQMLALGRAMIAKPKLLLVDELSLGLAPLIVIEIYKQLRVIGETMGTAMLVVEQNANLALSFAQSAYLLQQGRVVMSGSAAQVAASPEMKASYLGEAKSIQGAA
jgi:branched-chain amino acid transport system ATP-binding protein